MSVVVILTGYSFVVIGVVVQLSLIELNHDIVYPSYFFCVVMLSIGYRFQGEFLKKNKEKLRVEGNL